MSRAPVALFMAVAIAMSLRVWAPWQEATYRAGMILRSHPGWRPLGSWNAGVISYFGGGGVVDLDGLVNDDLLPYIKSGTLGTYLAQRHITHIVETPDVWTVLAARSGLKDGRVAACIDERIRLFPGDPNDIANNEHLMYFHLDEKCLSELSAR